MKRSLYRWVGTLAFSLSTFAAAQTAPAPRFDIDRFVVDGNTLLSETEVTSVLAPFAGKARDLGAVQGAREALQEAYQRAGYVAVLVTIPEQEVRGGEVRLQVAQARIARVRVENNRFFDEANVRASLPALKEGASPNTREIAEAARVANDNPAKRVAVSLRAESLEHVHATIGVADEKPTKFSVFVDNTGTRPTGRYRAGMGYQHANLFNRDQVLTAQVITSPTKADDVLIAGMGYRIPIYRWRGAFDAVVGYSNVDAGVVQDLFSVSGSGSVFGLHYTQYLRRIGLYDQRLQLGWDRRAFRNEVTVPGLGESLVPNVTVQPVSASYTGRSAADRSDASFFVSVSRNIPGGGEADQEAFTASRPGARANYSILRAGGAYSRALPRDFVLRALFNAQYTRDLLVPGEQFGMGGVDNVRGFFERETASDIGRRFSVEGYSPDFGKRVGERWSARALVFADMARGRDNEPVRLPKNSLSSIGIGLRMSQGKSLAVRLDWGRVTEGAGTQPAGSDRLHFAVGYLL